MDRRRKSNTKSELLAIALLAFAVLAGIFTIVAWLGGQVGFRWACAIALIFSALLSGFLAVTVVAKREAERSEDRRGRACERLFEEAPVGYHEVDRDGRIVRVNQTELEMLGYSKDEMVGRFFWDFIEQKEAAKNAFWSRLTGTDSHSDRFERTRIRKDGSTFAGLSQSLALTDETGQIVGFRTTLQDVSEQKRLQAKALQARKGEAVTLLAGGIAHDFNNLLGIVYGYLSLAQMELKEKDLGTELLGKAEQGLQDAKELTAKLVQLTGGAGTGKEPVAIRPELENWVSEIARHHPVALEFNFLEQLRDVSVDRGQMRQAIQNIVINAAEAMPRGGIIRVAAANLSFSRPEEFPELALPPGDYVLLTIRDDGAGIREDLVPSIFDPDFSTKQRGAQKGLGLGLAVADAVIRRHGGACCVESEPGAGTSFHIYLPATDRIPEGPHDRSHGLRAGS